MIEVSDRGGGAHILTSTSCAIAKTDKRGISFMVRWDIRVSRLGCQKKSKEDFILLLLN